MPRPNYGPRISDKPNKSGKWEIVWTENGRSKRETTGKDSRRAALGYLVGWLQARDEAVERDAQPLPICELIDFYEAEHVAEHVKDKERLIYAAKPLRTFFGARLASDIDDVTIGRYTRARRNGELGNMVKDSTIRQELKLLSAVLHFAVRNTKRTHLSAADLHEIKMPAQSEPRHRVATEEELDRLMDAAQSPLAERLSRTYRFAALARWTAARRESIITLTWNRVDLDAGTIDFREEGRRVTVKRRVPLPIDDKLLPILIRARAEAVSLFVLDHTGTIHESWDAARKKAKLPDITPHVLRHSWATHAAERGVAPYTIATFLGDTLATVERNYMHRRPEYLREALSGSGVTPGVTPEIGCSQTSHKRTQTA